jgi:hypothetical protein
MTQNVFSRLQYSFDTTKFGDAVNLNPKVLKFLEQAAMPVPEWQAKDLNDNVIAPSRYYKNPAANIVTSLISNASSISGSTSSPNVFTYASTEAAQLSAAVGGFIIELGHFRRHTDNMSGLGIMGTDANIPSLDIATAVGNKVLEVVYKTDYAVPPTQVATSGTIFDPANNVITTANTPKPNATAMLGSFTSLYVVPDLTYYDSIITPSAYAIANSLTYVSGGEGFPDYYVSNVALSFVTSALSAVTAANTLIATRRTHDWNFFKKSKKLIEDNNYLGRFNAMGNTQKSLVNTLIGTDLLKNNLANVANSTSG